MANRDIRKTAALVRRTDRGGYDMSGGEFCELLDIAQEIGAAEAITEAFNFGYVLGHRATKAGKYTERKPTK